MESLQQQIDMPLICIQSEYRIFFHAVHTKGNKSTGCYSNIKPYHNIIDRNEMFYEMYIM